MRGPFLSPHLSRSPLSVLDMVNRSGVDVVAGAGSPLEARLIEAAGFEAVYISGYAMAAAIHGRPDLGIVAAAETIANVFAIREVTTAPLIVDADTGYGDVANVREVVRRLERAGAGAVQLEDQVWPKRCGHLAGKKVIPADDMARKVRAAVSARRSEDTAIIARTDARAPLGIDEAIARADVYRRAGADAVFIDAPESVAELRRIGEEVKAPTVANMSETGVTPLLSAAELQDLGFSIALFPTAALRVGARAMAAFLHDLRRDGESRSWLDAMMSLDELNQTVGIGELADFESSIDQHGI